MKPTKSNPTADGISAIDAAIANAKARRATKTGTPVTASDATVSPATTAAKRPRLTDEEKTARAAQKDVERAAAKTARDAKRAAKKAQKDADRKPAHMSKVDKAFAKLPVLGELATSMFGDITANFSRDQVAALALHLQHFNRVKATERALNQKVEAGATVTIVGGDPRYVGKTATVTKAQRIRCYVSIEGVAKPVYLFTSDVEVQAAAATALAV